MVYTTTSRGALLAAAVRVSIIYQVTSSAMKSGNKIRQYIDGACEGER